MKLPTWINAKLVATGGGALLGLTTGPLGAIVGGALGFAGGSLYTKIKGSAGGGGKPAVPGLSAAEAATMLQGQQIAIAGGYYPSSMKISSKPDGTRANPYLMQPGHLYGPQGVWATQMVGGVQQYGQFSQPVFIMSRTLYKWVKAQ